MAEEFIEKALYEENDITILPSDSYTITIDNNLEDLKTDSGKFKISLNFVESEATASNFTTEGFCNVFVKYKSLQEKSESFFLNITRDKELDLGNFEDFNILNLKGIDVEETKIVLYNNSTTNLVINSIKLQQSRDVGITQIANILKEETINADIIQANGAVFSEAIFTQLLRTNVLSMITRNATPGDIVEYIEASDWTMAMKRVELSSETEQLTFNVEVGATVETISLWYAVIDGPDAYKYFTTKDPLELYPDMTPSERDEFKVLIYTPVTEEVKLSFTFKDTETVQGVPVITFGQGVGVGTNGQGFAYKDETGFYTVYHKDTNGEVIGIVMDSDGVHIVGWADQQLENITFKDNGVLFNFAGEQEQKFEYITDVEGNLTGYIQNDTNQTNINYVAGNV